MIAILDAPAAIPADLSEHAKQMANNWHGLIHSRDVSDLNQPEKWGLFIADDTRTMTPENKELHRLLWVFWAVSLRSDKDNLRHVFPKRQTVSVQHGYLVRVYDERGQITKTFTEIHRQLFLLQKGTAAEVYKTYLRKKIFALEWPGISMLLLSVFNGKRFPFTIEGQKYFLDLTNVRDTTGILDLVRLECPIQWWQCDTGYFNYEGFLKHLTDETFSYGDIVRALGTDAPTAIIPA